jgi:iron complex transport system substrate-binding protein
MSLLSRIHLGLIAVVLAAGIARAAAAEEAAAEEASRIVAIGGAVTEIVFALGEQHRLAARDATSTWPPEAEALPDVGYMRALSAEGVLSLAPDLLIAEEGAGPPEALELLGQASVPLVTVPDAVDGPGILSRIEAVAAALGRPEKGAALVADVSAALAEAEAEAAGAAGDKRVLFILSAQGGRLLASGTGTAADGIIRMAGGVNAIDGFEGYKTLTDEAAAVARPDVILMMDRSGDHAADDAQLFALPALAGSPAAEAGAVVRMNGLLLLGFGPRTAEAVRTLSRALNGAPS